MYNSAIAHSLENDFANALTQLKQAVIKSDENEEEEHWIFEMLKAGILFQMGETEQAQEIYASAIDAVDIDDNNRAVAQLNQQILAGSTPSELYKIHLDTLNGQNRLSPT